MPSLSVVLAAGLTPAWQQILVFDAFRVGSVNRAREVHRCASGKVINVALALGALRALPVRMQALALLGGAPGDAIQQQLAGRSCALRRVAARAPTRTCTTIVDLAASRSTELVENAGPVEPEELAGFRQAFVEEAARAAVVVLTGSLPPGARDDYYAQLLRETQAAVILDARGPELLAALERRPLVVKPNRDELAATLGRPLTDDRQLLEAMLDLCRRGAQWVLVTSGAGPVWLRSRSEIHRLAPPRIGVVNPIGSGDCLAAGLAAALAAGRSLPEALRLGAAAAVENAATLKPAEIDGQRVLKRAAQLEVQRIV